MAILSALLPLPFLWVGNGTEYKTTKYNKIFITELVSEEADS